ncbi:hypothetical protein HAHI6034_07345 [Hathewaya histolytica]|uniref:PQQ-dependent catabolism-associated beta-propeller protein n=1 Tax=Hathewaya histolytica TaxID=1498 RepID=A0A4U9QVD8_HATHI|nr:hypothetical protein [Hathewaya histolytica]VTQ82626.1 PQQ-dependent catabolism-associated beta-propeller protein [Hathewaya histolytica]
MNTKDSNEKLLYYISNLGNNTITIIDGNKKQIIETIPLTFKPFRLQLYKNHDVYIGSNLNYIETISRTNNTLKKVPLKNNGTILIDSITSNLYVSNISEVLVYDLKKESIIHTLKGFGAVDVLKLNSDGSKLFILDVLYKELKVYDTNSLRLLWSISNIGIKPSSLTIDENSKKIYIGNKGGLNVNSGDISVVNMETKTMKSIPLSPYSSITSLTLKNHTLYACNKKLQRIDLIDIRENKPISYIKTTASEPESILLNPMKDELIVVNRNSKSYGSLDIINTKLNKITNSILLDRDKSEPYDICVVHIAERNTKKDGNIYENLKKKSIKKESEIRQTPIIVKRILSSYKETFLMQKIVTDIPKQYTPPFKLEKVVFKKGFIPQNNYKINVKKHASNKYFLKFILKIPYKIKFKDGKGITRTLKNSIEKEKSIELSIPDLQDKKNLEVFVDTHSQITNDAILIKDIYNFSLEVDLNLKIIKDMEVMIPLSALQ